MGPIGARGAIGRGDDDFVIVRLADRKGLGRHRRPVFKHRIGEVILRSAAHRQPQRNLVESDFGPRRDGAVHLGHGQLGDRLFGRLQPREDHVVEDEGVFLVLKEIGMGVDQQTQYKVGSGFQGKGERQLLAHILPENDRFLFLGAVLAQRQYPSVRKGARHHQVERDAISSGRRHLGQNLAPIRDRIAEELHRRTAVLQAYRLLVLKLKGTHFQRRVTAVFEGLYDERRGTDEQITLGPIGARRAIGRGDDDFVIV